MELEPLMGRYFRLKRELSVAYRDRPWQARKIDRLANELTVAEREIASRQPALTPVSMGTAPIPAAFVVRSGAA